MLHIHTYVPIGMKVTHFQHIICFNVQQLSPQLDVVQFLLCCTCDHINSDVVLDKTTLLSALLHCVDGSCSACCLAVQTGYLVWTFLKSWIFFFCFSSMFMIYLWIILMETEVCSLVKQLWSTNFSLHIELWP